MADRVADLIAEAVKLWGPVDLPDIFQSDLEKIADEAAKQAVDKYREEARASIRGAIAYFKGKADG